MMNLTTQMAGKWSYTHEWSKTNNKNKIMVKSHWGQPLKSSAFISCSYKLRYFRMKSVNFHSFSFCRKILDKITAWMILKIGSYIIWRRKFARLRVAISRSLILTILFLPKSYVCRTRRFCICEYWLEISFHPPI